MDGGRSPSFFRPNIDVETASEDVECDFQGIPLCNPAAFAQHGSAVPMQGRCPGQFLEQRQQVRLRMNDS